jgi:hypothetical protein
VGWAPDHDFTFGASWLWDDPWMLRSAALILLLSSSSATTGCAARSPQPIVPWRFEARPTHGTVEVLPVLVAHDPLPPERDDYVGAGLPWIREWLRSEREAEIAEVPGLLGRALPAAVTAELGPRWDGTFRVGAFPIGGRAALRRVLARNGEVDAVLETLPHTETSVLVTWVTDLDAHALTTDGWPGEIVTTSAGPVVLDHIEEPYLVEAAVGMALVAPDGEVVLRYADRFTTVLSARRGPRRAAQDLARDLAREVALVWATDPRLEPGVPSDPSETRMRRADSARSGTPG